MRIFFATDIHGSETCFRKFLNAGQAYGADVLIMGGDITGKMLVPIVHADGGAWEFQWLGAAYSLPGEAIPNYERQMRMSGAYPYRTTPGELAHLEADPAEIKRIFRQVMRSSVEGWLRLAKERLGQNGAECYITPGNDDDLLVDEAFQEELGVKNPEGQVVILKDEIEMVSTGWTNRTPWKSPRELEEEQLFAKIEAMADRLVSPRQAIFNIHCPPYDSGLDAAPRVDQNLKPVTGIGGVEMGPVGSTAVRQAIRCYQPLLGLHGHVHEGRGTTRLGPTLCVNPGSEYSEGILKGCLLLLDKNGVKDYMLTSG